MKHFFLYRLFKHSKLACSFVVLFMVCYAIIFSKKMDMVFFPYNSMYSIDLTKNSKATTYGMKINGDRINITHQLYWKKDFLETSLYGYNKYMRQDQTVFLNGYLQQKFSNEPIRNILLSGLTPGKKAAVDWPGWYASFAGYTVPANASIELIQYNFTFEQNRALLTDSLSIYKTILP